VAANTFLPTGEGTPNAAFLAWRAYSQEVETFQSGNIVNAGIPYRVQYPSFETRAKRRVP
jgi:hypothetical protein